MEKKRRNYIDLLKGISILTLIFLHFEDGVMTTDYNFLIVRSPAFYFIVGWLWGMSSKRRTIKEHIEKRKKTLIMPYLWFSLIFILFDGALILLNLMEPIRFFEDIYKTVILRGIGTLWFLPALLGGEIITIYMRDRKRKWQFLAVLLTIMYIILYYYWTVHWGYQNQMFRIVDAPFRVVNNILSAWIVIFLAYQISLKWSSTVSAWPRRKLLTWGISLLMFSFVVINFVKPHVYWGLSVWLIDVFSTQIIGISGAILICMVIENSKIMAPLVYCGRNSLILMATHYTILLQIFILISKYFFSYTEFTGYITIVSFLIAMFIQYFIVEFINSKARFLIGK